MRKKSSDRSLLSWRWNGREIRPLGGGIPPDDRGFRYGQHVFESIAVRNKRVIMGAEHLVLLKSSAGHKDIPLSRALAAALRNFLKDIELSDGMLRIYLTAGIGAPASPIRNPCCYVTWEETRFPTSSEIRKGIRVSILRKPFLGVDWGIKGGNYEPHIRAIAAARAAGVDEAIVLDARGEVLSCAMGNLLVWLPSGRGEVLCISPGGIGARPGTILTWVKRKHKVLERTLRLSSLRRAVAMAVTNSRLGVMPVIMVDGRGLPDPSPAWVLANDYLKFHGLLGRA